MPLIFGRLFGKDRGLALARSAELRGDLAHAAILFAQAGHFDEAARVMVLRGDGEPDLAVRLRHYLQAAATAPRESPAYAYATRRRATTLLAALSAGPPTAALRQDLAEVARALDELGDHTLAAEAYATTGDTESQARSLAMAGELERLDHVLSEQHGRERERLADRAAGGEFSALVESGQRREAAAIARRSGDPRLRERGLEIERRRVDGCLVDVAILGARLAIVLGDEIVIGRQPDPLAAKQGGIGVSSAAVSRRHVMIGRREGVVAVRDLGSRNGTSVRGLSISGEIPVEDGAEVLLGGEVRLLVRTGGELPGAITLEVGGARWVAPLGAARLGVGTWRLERGDDDWVELWTGGSPPAFAGQILLADPVTLLAGDAVAIERAGRPVLEVFGRAL